MSRIYDALRRASLAREQVRGKDRDEPLVSPPVGPEVSLVHAETKPGFRRHQVITVTSNKGGVGKTTLATNLAVYLRALREDLPVLVMSLDDQPMLDRMFAFEGDAPSGDMLSTMRSGHLASAVRLGQYGVHFVPTSATVGDLKLELNDPFRLQKILDLLDWDGVILLDTKSDFEILTRSAIAASDLALVVVADQASLYEARRVFDQLEEWQRPKERARIVLSMVDRRIKYRDGEEGDVLGLLLQDVREQGYPLLRSFLSRSPKVEALYTNPSRTARAILDGARGSLPHRQMRRIAEEVLELLGSSVAAKPEPPIS